MSDTLYLQDAGKIILGSEVYIIAGNTVLMHRRADTKKTFPGFWIGPGGHIDKSEDALAAAIREVREETGVTIDDWNVSLKAVAFHNHIDRGELYILFIYRAVIPSGQQVQLPNSEGESRWIPIRELATLQNVFPASKYYFDHVLNDQPGILYTNLTLENAQITKVSSQRKDITS